MKHLIYIILLLVVFISCKENDAAIPSIATFNVINMVSDAGAIKVNPLSGVISFDKVVQQTNYLSGGLYYVNIGVRNFKVAQVNDTTKTLFNRVVNLERNMYTLYLSGTVAATDTMWREETNFPTILTDVYIPPVADSVVNVRFVNLSANSPALKVKLSISGSNEVDILPYKGISSFKSYPARLVSTAYSFQIRRVDDDALVTTFNFNATPANRFRNIALVIRGVFGTTTGAASFGVSTINYY